MAQSKRTRKSDQHQSTRSRHKAKQHDDKHASETQADDGAQADASAVMLPHDAQDGNSSPVGQQAMPLALLPQRLPAEYEAPRPMETPATSATKRRIPVAVQAILISVCLTAAVILSLGVLKGSRNATQAVQAEPAAPLVVAPIAQNAEAGPANAPASKKSTKPALRGDAKPSSLANQARASASHTDKRVHAQAGHAEAGNAKKKQAVTVAKATKKPVDGHAMPLLAQNDATAENKPASILSNYAQCQELSNFFRREQCKWQACNGKWGQDGCPSYSNGNRELN